MAGSEFADDFCRIAVLSVDGLIHAAHVIGSDFAGQRMESLRDLRKAM